MVAAFLLIAANIRALRALILATITAKDSTNKAAYAA